MNPINSSSSSQLDRYLWFQRQGVRYSVPMKHLLEVLPRPSLRPLPEAEPALAGLMNLRSGVLPVFDPWSLDNSEEPDYSQAAIVVVVGVQNQPCLGLLAETVGKVVELEPPVPLAKPARVTAAFSGQANGSGLERIRVIDVPALAETMGLLEPAVSA